MSFLLVQENLAISPRKTKMGSCEFVRSEFDSPRMPLKSLLLGLSMS